MIGGDALSTPLAKQVSFGPTVVEPLELSSPGGSTSALPSTSKDARGKGRRRSSMKEGVTKPFAVPPKHLHQHADPLLRRLRLRDQWGAPVDLEAEFRDAKVVLFLFGAWTNGYREAYDTVERFLVRHPHRCKVVYCSVDITEEGYKACTEKKPWLSMEWDDGSNLPDISELASPSSATPASPREPFLLATDTDLESEMHHSDPSGTLYLRPYSRVFLAEKFKVLGIPNVVVYHLGKAEVLSEHARIDSLKDAKGDEVWEKWEKGERVEFNLGELVHRLRWTLSASVVAIAYVVAVRVGGVDDVVGKVTEQLGRSLMSRTS